MQTYSEPWMPSPAHAKEGPRVTRVRAVRTVRTAIYWRWRWRPLVHVQRSVKFRMLWSEFLAGIRLSPNLSQACTPRKSKKTNTLLKPCGWRISLRKKRGGDRVSWWQKWGRTGMTGEQKSFPQVLRILGLMWTSGRFSRRRRRQHARRLKMMHISLGFPVWLPVIRRWCRHLSMS